MISLLAPPGVNFEDVAEYMLEVKVTDLTGLMTSANITVNINDVNDAPVITSLDNTTSLPEDTAGGTTVYHVSTEDQDGDSVTYSMTSTPDQAVFQIDSSTGKITTLLNFDFETTAEYTLQVDPSLTSLYCQVRIVMFLIVFAFLLLVCLSVCPSVRLLKN